ncbi:thioredoxin domain-containing protein [Labilibaculum sp. K2S]|uniref:thioredoxin domain-containing protein n=1 Tax=Labilibaculum sp. K2S TaxID=3056386 RepID=UPI0025A434DC|nr:thioredoxin domain-containing protein [Labilibaculum sp. K2S]MDM8158464.1 thioredoxin domain-containing protein [Labilibaculum sp. K2S]
MFKKSSIKLQLGFILSLFFFTHNGLAQTEQDTSQITFTIGTEVYDYPEVQWIKGDSITKFDKDKIYIIECWATWCGPCKGAIPHLNELHKKYEDKIVIVGQNVFENNLARVKKFVAGKGDEMSYRVAYSGGTESDFSKKWLKPAGINSIPITIVIQNNRVIWMPHPNGLTDGAIDLLINKEFSEEKLKELSSGSKIVRIRNLIFDDKKYDEALVATDEILLEEPDNELALIYKSAALKRSGKSDEALAYFEKRRQEKFLPPVLFQLYSILMEEEQFDQLIKYVNIDFDRALLENTSAAGDIIASGYEAYVAKKDYKGLVAFINRVSNSTTDSDLLKTTFVVAAYYPVTPMVKIVDDAIYNVASKFLKENQLDFGYLALVTQMFWANNEKEYAKTMVKRSLELAVKENLPETGINVLKMFSDSLDKGIFPTEAELEKMAAEMAK